MQAQKRVLDDVFRLVRLNPTANQVTVEGCSELAKQLHHFGPMGRMLAFRAPTQAQRPAADSAIVVIKIGEDLRHTERRIEACPCDGQ